MLKAFLGEIWWRDEEEAEEEAEEEEGDETEAADRDNGDDCEFMIFNDQSLSERYSWTTRQFKIWQNLFRHKKKSLSSCSSTQLLMRSSEMRNLSSIISSVPRWDNGTGFPRYTDLNNREGSKESYLTKLSIPFTKFTAFSEMREKRLSLISCFEDSFSRALDVLDCVVKWCELLCFILIDTGLTLLLSALVSIGRAGTVVATPLGLVLWWSVSWRLSADPNDAWWFKEREWWEWSGGGEGHPSLSWDLDLFLRAAAISFGFIKKIPSSKSSFLILVLVIVIVICPSSRRVIISSESSHNIKKRIWINFKSCRGCR
jgi:hypothetical protein